MGGMSGMDGNYIILNEWICMYGWMDGWMEGERDGWLVEGSEEGKNESMNECTQDGLERRTELT